MKGQSGKNYKHKGSKWAKSNLKSQNEKDCKHKESNCQELVVNSGHFNAHSLDFLTEFPKALSFLDQKTNVAVIVLSGNGDHFCSGIDLKALSSITFESSDHGRTAERVRREIKRFQEPVTAVERCRKPVITAVHGACIGGGVDIITACDIRCRKPVIASSIGCLCEPFNCRFEFLLACKGNLASTDLGFCCSSQHKSSLLYVQRDVSSVLDVLRLLAIALGLFQGLDDERGDGGDDGDFGLAVLDGELHGDSEAGSVIPRASSIGCCWVASEREKIWTMMGRYV
ncbi:uncharacterized protein LOC114300552 [Camellia sinensis]|uniref:uncharacterized protein LOC114300552 n=1 Tax=Camellia sinensis TaxID=4442 RepID=UPI0010360D0B|nr:uncharacterized protein LOC114300552 [Camellia sinensis]